MESPNRKEEIIQFAARLFRERGYQAVSMRDLAAAIHIKAASLYNHFNGKQSILEAIVIPTAQQFTQGMLSIRNAKQSPVEQLKSVIQLHITLTLQNPDAMACLNNDWIHLEGEAFSSVSRMRDDYEFSFRQIIREGIEQQQFEAIDEEIVLYSFLSTLRTLYQWYIRKRPVNQQNMSNNIVQVLMQGIIQKD
jgi:AcrR family transcriptional regulator